MSENKRFTTDDGLEDVLCWEINDKKNENMTCGECVKLLNEYVDVKKENEQLKQELFETSKELLWATSDEVDRALHYEDEVEELRKEIFE